MTPRDTDLAGYIISRFREWHGILTYVHRTNLARTCNASPPPKRFTCIVRRRERSRGHGPSSQHLVTSIHMCRILQKRANRFLMPTSQLVFPRNEGERDAGISPRVDDHLIIQAVLVTVSAPSSCHMPDKSPGGRTSCSPLPFLNSSLSSSIPLNVRTYECHHKQLANSVLHTLTQTLSPSLPQLPNPLRTPSGCGLTLIPYPVHLGM